MAGRRTAWDGFSTMRLICYPKLSTRSRRAIVREKTKWGRPYYYRPRANLMMRLSRETGMTVGQVYNQLMVERLYLLRRM